MSTQLLEKDPAVTTVRGRLEAHERDLREAVLAAEDVERRMDESIGSASDKDLQALRLERDSAERRRLSLERDCVSLREAVRVSRSRSFDAEVSAEQERVSREAPRIAAELESAARAFAKVWEQYEALHQSTEALNQQLTYGGPSLGLPERPRVSVAYESGLHDVFLSLAARLARAVAADQVRRPPPRPGEPKTGINPMVLSAIEGLRRSNVLRPDAAGSGIF